MLAVFISNCAGFIQNQHTPILPDTQTFGHGNGIQGLDHPIAVEEVGGDFLILQGQGQIRRGGQIQIVDHQGSIVGSAIGLTENDLIGTGEGHALDPVRCSQDDVRHGERLRTGQAPVTFAHVKAEDIAAIFAAVGCGGGIVHVGGQVVLCLGVVEITDPEVAAAVVHHGR